MKKFKEKFYNIVGRAVTFITFWLLAVYLNYNLLSVILDKCITVYK